MAAVVKFDPVAHAYYDGARRVPSVTEILHRAGMVDDAWFTPEATELGTRVHQALALSDRGLLDPASVDSRLLPYLEAWRTFRRVDPQTFAEIEQPRLSANKLFAGTPDRVTDSWDILDIKTGSPARWHIVQLGGYACLLGRVMRLRCVYLSESGTYRVEMHHPSSAMDLFHCALGVATWKGFEWQQNQ